MDECKKIYHITHINNLASILQEGLLWCDAKRIELALQPVGIAYEHIKRRRLTTTVPVAKGQMLADYVPFYFCIRSPMLYAIHKKSVSEYQEGQENIIYFVSSTDKIMTSSPGLFCFTDGHAVEAVTNFFTSAKDLNKLDWPLINHSDWRNTEEDLDRKRRKQAEFLLHQSVSLQHIEKIGVFSNTQRSIVQSLLQDQNISIPVTIERQWYY